MTTAIRLAETQPAILCDTCGGEGVVLWSEGQRGVPGGTIYGDCPDCDGKGALPLPAEAAAEDNYTLYEAERQDRLATRGIAPSKRPVPDNPPRNVWPVRPHPIRIDPVMCGTGWRKP